MDFFSDIFKADSQELFSTHYGSAVMQLSHKQKAMRQEITTLETNQKMFAFLQHWQTAHARLYVKLKESPYGDNVGVQMLEQMILDTSFWGMGVNQILSGAKTLKQENLSTREHKLTGTESACWRTTLSIIAYNSPLLTPPSTLSPFQETSNGPRIHATIKTSAGPKTYSINLMRFCAYSNLNHLQETTHSTIAFERKGFHQIPKEIYWALTQPHETLGAYIEHLMDQRDKIIADLRSLHEEEPQSHIVLTYV